EPIADLPAAALWGLVRTAQTEYPDRAIVLVDLDGHPASLASLPAALASTEPQIALRNGALMCPRLARARAADALAPPTDTPAWRLQIPQRGSFEQLQLLHCDAGTELSPGQLRIAVRAAGLNFRDVLDALGLYPGGAEFLGAEGAGVVLA